MKLFIFVGDLVQAKVLPARENVNEARFSARYKILDRVCGHYSGDTINFEVIQSMYDSSFKKTRYQLLMLTRDAASNENYALWGGFSFDVFRTSDRQWACSYLVTKEILYAGQKPLKLKKIHFSKDAFYDTRGMTLEEIDIRYPEPYYKIKKGRAIPVMGNSIDEIFQHEKAGALAYAGIYDLPPNLNSASIPIKEVSLEEIKPVDADSVKRANERDYLSIRDSLLEDPFNEEQIGRLMRNCGLRGDYDDCLQFFDNLIRENPDSIQAYLLKAKFRHSRASLKDSSRIFVLQQALKVDSDNYEVNSDMAISYYQLFEEQPSNYYAYNARKYFIRCIDIDRAQVVLLKYPVIQLSNYLNDTTTANTYQKLTDKQNWYFPIEPFIGDSSKWAKDYSINVLDQLESAKFRVNWFSKALALFNEPLISDGSKGEVYRCLWLRSFHEPIVIRMERHNQTVIIYWKILQFNASLQTFQSPVEFKKNIAVWQWKNFEKSLTTIDYWSMVSGDYLSRSTDGAVWLLEAAINGKHKVTERKGDTYPKYTKCLRYLLDLTDMHIPKNRIY